MKIFSWFNLYIIVFLLCIYRSELIETGNALSQIISALGLILSGICMFIVNCKYKPSLYLKILNVFVLMITIYGIIRLFSYEQIYITEIDYKLVNKRDYMFKVFHSIFPIYAFYMYTKNKKMSEFSLRNILFISLILSTISYWLNYQDQLITAILRGVNNEEFTNNTGYLFLSCVPLLFFFKKKLFQYILLAYTYYYIIISMKRGAILIGLFSLLYFLYERYNNANKRERYGIICFTLILTIIGFYFLQSYYLSSDYFQSRLESTLSGDASNRDVFYPKLIQYYIYQTSFFEFIFGSGADYTIKILGNYAHNDWLEILINNGFLGVLIYLFLYISLFRTYLVKSKNMPDHVRNAFFVTIFIMTSKTLFSMSYSSLGVGIPICLGYCLAYDTRNMNINKFKS